MTLGRFRGGRDKGGLNGLRWEEELEVLLLLKNIKAKTRACLLSIIKLQQILCIIIVSMGK